MKAVIKWILFVSVMAIAPILAAQQTENIYIETTSRSVPPGGNSNFLEFVREVIKPMYQDVVDEGHLQGWYLWRTRYRSDDESYFYIAATSSSNLANLESPLMGSAAAAAERTHGMSEREWNNAAERGASSVERRELWIQRPQSVLVGTTPARYSSVRYYRMRPGQQQNLVRELNEFSSPWQRGRLERGISAGWAFFTRAYPFDGADSYDMAEVGYYDEFSQITGAGIGQQIWNDVREDGSEISQHQANLRETRDMVKMELWELVDYAIPQ